MVTADDFVLADLSAKCVASAASGQDDNSVIRIRYDGPREGAIVQAFGSTLAFYHYTQSTKFTLDTAVGGDGRIYLEASNSGVATVSKAGQFVSMINAATYWRAWLDGASYDSVLSASCLFEVTYGTATTSSSDVGSGVLTQSAVLKWNELAIGYVQKYTDLVDDVTVDTAKGPKIFSAGDPDNQKQGHAEIDGILVNGSVVTGSTVQATLSVVAEKVAATGTTTRRTIGKFNIRSLNNSAVLGPGKDYLSGIKLCGNKGERLIVRLESAGSLDTASINVSGRWVPNVGLGQ